MVTQGSHSLVEVLCYQFATIRFRRIDSPYRQKFPALQTSSLFFGGDLPQFDIWLELRVCTYILGLFSGRNSAKPIKTDPSLFHSTSDWNLWKTKNWLEVMPKLFERQFEDYRRPTNSFSSLSEESTTRKLKYSPIQDVSGIRSLPSMYIKSYWTWVGTHFLDIGWSPLLINTYCLGTPVSPDIGNSSILKDRWEQTSCGYLSPKLTVSLWALKDGYSSLWHPLSLRFRRSQSLVLITAQAVVLNMTRPFSVLEFLTQVIGRAKDYWCNKVSRWQLECVFGRDLWIPALGDRYKM